MPPGASGSVKTILLWSVVHHAVGQKRLYQLWLLVVKHLVEEPPDDGLILFYRQGISFLAGFLWG